MQAPHRLGLISRDKIYEVKIGEGLISGGIDFRKKYKDKY